MWHISDFVQNHNFYKEPRGSAENLLGCESKKGDVGDERMDYAEIRD